MKLRLGLKGLLPLLVLAILATAARADDARYARPCADDQDFVTSLYQSILKRQPDAGGHRYWMGQLASGSSREWVIAQFFESQEYTGFRHSNRDYARDLYMGILGRMPDTGGWNHWVSQLDGGRPRAEIRQAFFDSPEYRGIASRCP